MAKNASVLKVRKKKTVRKTVNETYLVNKKYLGDEPEPRNETMLRVDFMNALTWYNYMCDVDEARSYIIDYLKANKKDDLVKKVKRVPNAFLPITAAWVFRMHLRGHKLEGDAVERAEQMLKQSFQYMEAEKKEEKVVDKPSIQERIADKVSDVIGDIEALIDTGEKFSLYEHLQKNEIPAMYAGKIVEYYKPLAVEVAEAMMGKDEQLKEGFKRYSKQQLRDLLAVYTSLVEEGERYAGNIRKQRAPRKKKTVSVDKKLKNFKYMKELPAMKLTSVSPTSIIGAQELWVFNTSNKVLTVFRARGPAGLDVNRTSITGFDVDTSVSKKIGRNTEKVIDRVLNGGKVVLRKLFDDEISSGYTKTSERLNTNTILLKTVR